MSLDDYLGEIEAPSEQQLSDEEETTTAGEVLDNALNNIADSIPVVDTADDALPAIADIEVRGGTEGFDAASQNPMRLGEGGITMPKQSPQELEAEIRREAYDAAITGLFPLSDQNIRDLLERYDGTQRAVQKPIKGIPTAQVNVQTISLDPGVAPMTLKTATGFITTLNILDVTGAPWPIQDISWAGDFEVVEPEEGGHIVRITPMSVEAYGNMSIRLLTLKTPVTIQLETGTDQVQYRVDARIPEYGPFADTPIIGGDGGSIERVAGNSTIMTILDGVTPSDAQTLYMNGVDGRTSAYRYNNMTYVRTPLTLLSPGWSQSARSADGMNVYALNDTPVLLLSDNGRFVRANLSLDRDILDD